jgi:hypothetical protein
MDWNEGQTPMYLGSPAASSVVLVFTARGQVERLGEIHSCSVHPSVTTREKGCISNAWLLPYGKKCTMKLFYGLIS